MQHLVAFYSITYERITYIYIAVNRIIFSRLSIGWGTAWTAVADGCIISDMLYIHMEHIVHSRMVVVILPDWMHDCPRYTGSYICVFYWIAFVERATNIFDIPDDRMALLFSALLDAARIGD